MKRFGDCKRRKLKNMTRMSNYAAMRLLVWVLVVSLTGCAPIQTAGLKPGQAMPSGHGLVAVQVVSNTDSLSTHLRNWSEIVVVDRERNDATGRPLAMSIPAVIDGMSSSRVFVGTLPPGSYRLAALRAHRATSGMGAYSAIAPLGEALGSFRVDSNSFTSLGTVYFQPLYADPLSSKIVGSGESMRFVVSRIDDQEALHEFAASRHPHAIAALEGRAALGWDDDPMAEKRQQLQQAIRAFALLGRPQHRGGDDSLVLGGRLGTLHRRNSTGEWIRSHVQGNREILAYRETNQGIFAGGERGLICRAVQFSGPWSCSNLSDRNQSIVWIGSSPGGTLYLVTRERGRVRLYVDADEDQSGWELLREFGRLVPVTSADLTNAIARPVPAMFRDGRLSLADIDWSYDLDTRLGSAVPSFWPALVSLAHQPNGIALASPSSSWTGTKPPILSRDFGETWISLQRIGVFHTFPYALGSGDVVAIDSDSTYVFVGWRKKENVAVLRAAPNSAENRIVGHVPYGCSEILHEVSHDHELIVRCFDGTLMLSRDAGASWEVGYPRTVREEAIPAEFIVEAAWQ